ncbi:polymorphic toxin-type HINT domain-containing protein [Streptomyces luteireticuli]|uniref:polymorphic toxin-type HINT domain-containing protein n=1 Tax=Streptomyces luteireticuli TaxID=173858 RepID=UPI003556BA32
MAWADEQSRDERRPETQTTPSIPVTDVGMKPLPEDETAAAAKKPLPTVQWPAAASAEAQLADSGAARSVAPKAGAKKVRVGSLPVRVGAPASGQLERSARAFGAAPDKQAAGPGKVRVDILDRSAARKAGVDGILLKVTRADGGKAAAPVNLEVDYAKFAGAYGGDWASRLTLAALPGCAVDGSAAACRDRKALKTHNSVRGGTLTADVAAQPAAPKNAAAAAAPQLLAVTAGAAGSAGSYGATSLAPSGSWQMAGNTGSFSWQYPLRVPPAVAGPSPKLAINYNSGSIDGRVGSTNNQPSWVGEGFDLSVGFIERSYQSCKEDGHDTEGEEKYDQCWHSDNATMNFGGRNGELVKKSDGTWRLKSDDGTRIERKTGGSNDDNDGEYWVVTTTDGTRYYFGKGKRTSDDKENTKSAWTTPVYGDDKGEPCHGDTFKDSRCQQAWRWNLDYVVDVHGNSMTYYWDTEKNRYGVDRDDTSVSYDRGGYLKRIEYGTREGTERSGKAPAQVVFNVAERCTGAAADCEPGDLKEETAKRWPDVPYDQICTDDKHCKDQWAPTFFTRKRLSSITTQVLKGNSYQDVDEWLLDHYFPVPGDGLTGGLWLKSIAHNGKAQGSTISLPKTIFYGTQLTGRVDKSFDDRPAMVKWRVRAIQSESGGTVSVNYKAPECTPSNLPDPANNTKRCFPSFWSKSGSIGEKEDWFHKYVVDNVVEDGRLTKRANKETRYDYLGGAAWHYDESEIVKAKNKTWSQWRGFQKIRVTVGDTGTKQLRTETTYLRGMDGDRKNKDGGTQSVTVRASDGTEVKDLDRTQTFVLEQRQFNGSYDDSAEVAGKVNTPWVSEPTAVEGDDKATLAGTARTVNRTALDKGVRRTGIEHTYDSYGMLAASHDLGDMGTDGKNDGDDAKDDTCTVYEYARNTDANLLTLVKRTATYSKACGRSTSSSDAISEVRTSYDHGPYGVAPSKGDVTRTEELKGFDGDTPQFITVNESDYDAHGRVVSTTDVGKRTTTTEYTPATGGPVTGMTVTDALKRKVTSTVDPAWGLVTGSVDANRLRTDMVYDSLGRRLKVWLPGRSKSSDLPNSEYVYLIRDDAPNVITTKSLLPNGDIKISYQLHDGLLRPVQTQGPSPNGGRVISDTMYDSRGLAVKAVGPYFNAKNPDTSVVNPEVSEDGAPTENETVYDAAGRKTDAILKVKDKEKWRTTTTYHGDHTDVTPPSGETPRTTYTNAQGLTTKLLEYKGSTPTGEADTTSYTYDRTGQMTSAQSPSGDRWSFEYDVRGRKVASDDPDKGRTELSYNDLDQVVSSTDARKKTLNYQYDLMGRPTAVYDGKTQLTGWTYDTAPNGIGRPATTTRFVKDPRAAEPQAYTTVVDAYDTAGHPTKSTIKIPKVEGKLAGDYTTSTTYNPDGSIKSAALPGGGGLPAETINIGYNLVGLPLHMLGLSDYVRETKYSNYGETLQLGMGLSSGDKYTWRTNNYEEGTRRLQRVRLDRESVKDADSDVNYTYDPAGNTTKIADTPPNRSVDVQCFRYDYLRRLTDAWAQGTSDCATDPAKAVLGSPAPYRQSFEYDVAGNRTKEVNYATTPDGTQTTRVYHPRGKGNTPSHALESVDVTETTGGKTVQTKDTYEYDAVGNTTSRKLGTSPKQNLVWDVEGRLSQLTPEDGKATSFVYDAGGNRLLRRDPTSNTTTLYLGSMELALDTKESDPAKQSVTGTRYYAHGGQQIAVRTPKGVHWLGGGQNGTAELAVNAKTQELTQRRTLPFGGPRDAKPVAWPNDKGFLGGTMDSSTGLTHLGAREYDPNSGRFISVDPVADLSDPQQLHAYAYGRNNPLGFPDPSGKLFGISWDDVTDFVEDYGHETLDVIGMVPVVGEWADGVNGLWYLGEGDYLNASLSFASAVPIAGYAATAAKGAKYVEEGADAAKAVEKTEAAVEDTAKTAAKTEEASKDVAKAAEEATPPPAPKPKPEPKPEAPAEPKPKPAPAAEKADPVSSGKAPDRGGKSEGGGKSSCSDNSFVPGTEVVLADGTARPIEKLEIGDKVLATDPEKGITEPKPVSATIEGHGTKQLVKLTVDTDGDRGTATDTITATANHPFWLPELKKWVNAEELKPGQWLRTSSGTWVQVTAVQAWTQQATVRNLTVDGIHTYYVRTGSTPVLVHNCKVTAAARAEADAASSTTPSKMRPAVAEALQLPNGKIYSSPSVRGEPPALHPIVQEILDDIPVLDRGVGHGSCGLAVCVSQALSDGHNPTGGSAAAVIVRGSKDHPKHGLPVGPCDSCVALEDAFSLHFRNLEGS